MFSMTGMARLDWGVKSSQSICLWELLSDTA